MQKNTDTSKKASVQDEMYGDSFDVTIELHSVRRWQIMNKVHVMRINHFSLSVTAVLIFCPVQFG